MLNKAKVLRGYTLHSLDGEIGKIQEFYFDDQYWTIRYLVGDTGNWLTGKQVLISPYALTAVSQDKQHIDIDLTKQQIEDSPSLSSDKPVSEQFERAYYGFYGYPTYWGGSFEWGPFPHIVRDREKWSASTQTEKSWDPHLRSTQEVSDYDIQSTDGEIGHVEDFIIDDEMWSIRYLIIDTRSWWSGKKVLISPQWIERLSWAESTAFVNLSGESIKHSPEYTEDALPTRDYETRLHRHYDRRGYWVDEPTANKDSR